MDITNEIVAKGYVFNSILIKIIDFVVNNNELEDNKKLLSYLNLVILKKN